MNCWVVRVEKGTLDGRSSWGRDLERTEGWGLWGWMDTEARRSRPDSLLC